MKSTIIVSILIVLTTFAIAAVSTKKTKESSEKPFAQRVDNFWQWFDKNTSRMDKLLQNKKNGMLRLNELMLEGSRIIGDDVCYHIGDDRTFSFSVEDQTECFYLYPWIVASMPDSLRAKWTVYPCKQPDPTVIDLGFGMFDKEVDVSSIMVSVDYNKSSNTFDIAYYSPTLAELSDEESKYAFTIILELIIGEGAAYNYIEDIRQKSDPTGMIPIDQLAGTMKLMVEDNGQEYSVKPVLPLYSYQGRPNPESKEIRSDIIVGSSRYLALQEEYLNGIQNIYNALASKGVTAIMLILTQPENMTTDDFIELRYKIEDYLTELFDSAAVKGMFIGGAYGASGLGYIDLLLFDAEHSLRYISEDKTIGSMLLPANDGAEPIQLMFKTFATDSEVYILR